MKSLNLPCKLESRFHCAVMVAPGAILPRSTVSELLPALAPTCEPMILKLTSRPFSFSTICGWADEIVRLPAPPLPTLTTCKPSAKASDGST